MCPQHDVLFEFLTVEEHILLFAQLKGAARADAENQAERMLSAFELLDRREYFAHGLSGGMKRKTCLAVALSGDTRLVILDEPTTGLHFQDIQMLIDVLQRLVDQGNTVLVIEHNLDVLKVADHLIDLGPAGGQRGGRIIATGTPEEVAANADSATGPFLRTIVGT